MAGYAACVLIASRNAGKIAEFKALLQGGYPPGVCSKDRGALEIRSLIDYPGLMEIEETGASFQENALLKASAAAVGTGLVAMADDSGLEVDYLKGAPGIYSSRYAGPECDDKANIKKLLEALDGVPASRRTRAFAA